MKLLFATTNAAKFREACDALGDTRMEILGLRDFPHVSSVPETGETFRENAVLKARGYFRQTDIPCIADDGGLIVDYLGGMPGVHSHRWLGHAATDQELAEAILERLEGVSRQERTARLGGVIAFWDGAHLLESENWLEGYVADRLMGEVRPGFPYRALLMIPEFNKAYAELTPEEHQKVNFRRKNLESLTPHIIEHLAHCAKGSANDGQRKTEQSSQRTIT
ncbi:MAG: hypothetical protein A3B37_03885 [Candidatus Sungbacteria bacterium RIFCSPLOWO2_01_FULL_59_16]|uniref:Non-canonical purine NTP pyrophosphatase n=1 Tax=Candidatus Sungbacteria bacterium RIFCSPLOWO2_01_FULL_59_16 TaxID=1802280 RepID=A0A1G2LCF1_9BACT|nr:MAG: hypothetical protein A3B37_03885 [Candidatus Sungbacteria bacterium RIFCSPLOWO2_01_FULL_59_16]